MNNSVGGLSFGIHEIETTFLALPLFVYDDSLYCKGRHVHACTQMTIRMIKRNFWQMDPKFVLILWEDEGFWIRVVKGFQSKTTV